MKTPDDLKFKTTAHTPTLCASAVPVESETQTSQTCKGSANQNFKLTLKLCVQLGLVLVAEVCADSVEHEDGVCLGAGAQRDRLRLVVQRLAALHHHHLTGVNTLEICTSFSALYAAAVCA